VKIISVILLTVHLSIVKFFLVKFFIFIVHINTKSINQLAKELKLHRNTVGRYHKRIREYLLENHENISFNGEIEMDEVYIIAGDKGVKKNPVY
jgi:hypothetical protein